MDLARIASILASCERVATRQGSIIYILWWRNNELIAKGYFHPPESEYGYPDPNAIKSGNVYFYQPYPDSANTVMRVIRVPESTKLFYCGK